MNWCNLAVLSDLVCVVLEFTAFMMNARDAITLSCGKLSQTVSIAYR